MIGMKQFQRAEFLNEIKKALENSRVIKIRRFISKCLIDLCQRGPSKTLLAHPQIDKDQQTARLSFQGRG